MAFVSRASRLSFRRPGLMSRLLTWGGLGLAIYAAASLLVFLLQDTMIYHPSRTRAAPPAAWIEPVELTTADGETLVAWHSDAMPGCPTFLFFDGNAGRPEIQAGRWRRIRAQGAGFLAVSYRGYSGSTGTPSEAGLHADANAGYDWLRGQGIAAREIVIHGFSLGSGPATRLAAEREAGALILEAPYYSLQDLLARKAPVLPVRWLLRHRYRSDEVIGLVDEPVFIAHGTTDRLIPISQSQRLAELVPDRLRYETFPGSDHASLVRDGLYDRIWTFLDSEWQAETKTCVSLSRESGI